MIAALTLSAGSASALSFRDERLGYSLTLPDEFEQTEGEPNGVTFVRGDPAEKDSHWAVIQIQPLGGTIGRGPQDLELVTKAARARMQGSGAELISMTVEPCRWSVFEVAAMDGRVRTPDGILAMRSTQVPLFTEAINVQVVTRSPNESAEILDAALARLEGRSSWLSSAERSRALGEALGKIAAVILGITGAAAWVFRRKKPKA